MMAEDQTSLDRLQASLEVTRSLAHGVGEPRVSLSADDAADILARFERMARRVAGPGLRTKGVLAHIRKELLEVEGSPQDLTEWVDVAVLALDGAWRSGHEPQAIIDATLTRLRPDWRTSDPEGPIEHPREAPDHG